MCPPLQGMLKSRGGGVGCDFWHRPPAVTVRDPAWGLTDRALGIIVDRSKSEGGVRKGAAGHAIGRGAAELVSPGPALGQMQGETPRLAGDASGEREEAPPEGLGGGQGLAQAEARGPACQVVGHRLYRQPCVVGGETAQRGMVEPCYCSLIPSLAQILRSDGPWRRHKG